MSFAAEDHSVQDMNYEPGERLTNRKRKYQQSRFSGPGQDESFQPRRNRDTVRDHLAVDDVTNQSMEQGRGDRAVNKRRRDDQYPRYDSRGKREGGNLPPRRNRDPVKERLAAISGPTTTLEIEEGGPNKFTGRCKLFVANLPQSINNEEFTSMFKPFGEISDVFLNAAKGFGLVKLDTKQNAEAAREALDYSIKDGKTIRIRLAVGSSLKIKHLSGWVSNELLRKAFSVFGEVERAVVIVDERGRPVGEGIVDFARKQAAQIALERCTNECFLLTASSRPVLVEPLELRDEEDGLPEKSLPKTNNEYMDERSVGPRFAEPGTAEYSTAVRWKKLYKIENQKREYLEREIMEARLQLEEEMEYLRYEHETAMLRKKLYQREELLRGRLEEARRYSEQSEQYRQEELMRYQGAPRRQEGNNLDEWQKARLSMMTSLPHHMHDRQEVEANQIRDTESQNMAGNAAKNGDIK